MRIMKEQDNKSSYIRAQKHVERIKDFYSHFSVYVLVNIFISSIKVVNNMSNGETFSEAFFDFSTFAVWLFWGIGVAIHAFSAFGLPFLFGRNWEEDKIKQFMEEESKNRWE